MEAIKDINYQMDLYDKTYHYLCELGEVELAHDLLKQKEKKSELLFTLNESEDELRRRSDTTVGGEVN